MSKAYESILPNIYKLSFWMPFIEKLNIPHIPCEFSNEFPALALLFCLEGDACEDLRKAIKWQGTECSKLRHSGFKPFFRFDEIALDDVKYLLSTGRGHSYNNIFGKPFLISDRALTYVSSSYTRFVLRPYVEPLIENNFPVEIRVFFDRNGFVGVSNYYPQRPLSPKYYEYMIRARDYAEKVYNLRTENWPYGFSMDFLVSKEGKLLFVDGNAPYMPNKYITTSKCCMDEELDKDYYYG